MLDEAGESFMLDVIRETEDGEETISIEKLTRDAEMSPIIRLVDTTIFTALQRRGVPSEGMVFPDEGHWVLKANNSAHWHEVVFAWLKRYLGN